MYTDVVDLDEMIGLRTDHFVLNRACNHMNQYFATPSKAGGCRLKSRLRRIESISNVK
jgi:hypothetical protein